MESLVLLLYLLPVDQQFGFRKKAGLPHNLAAFKALQTDGRIKSIPGLVAVNRLRRGLRLLRVRASGVWRGVGVFRIWGITKRRSAAPADGFSRRIDQSAL